MLSGVVHGLAHEPLYDECLILFYFFVKGFNLDKFGKEMLDLGMFTSTTVGEKT